ncbi:acyltransferase [Longimycelium tulufanense]|uniref:Acyltransferase n=1 Tax=Longimycelium tulufanense TaxID=907463 RepID=A0A8J3C9A0_9PSEU|nr:acyltransferase [Longimycelium tulufanense]
MFAVLVHHLTFVGPNEPLGIAAPPFESTYQFGASTLLVISAYFAGMTLSRYTSLQWWLRRMARLLPAYVAAVFLVFTFVRVFAPADWPIRPSVVDLVGNILLIQPWSEHIRYVDGSFWTLPVQVAGFTALAVLWHLRSRGRLPSLPILYAVILVPLFLRVTYLAHEEPSSWLVALVEHTGLHRAHLFVAGIAIWRWSNRELRFAHLFALLGLTLIALHEQPPAGDSVGAFAIMLGLICLAARGPDWRFLPEVLVRAVKWIAGISYGIYLVHQHIGYVIARRLTDLGFPSWVWVVATVCSAIVLGWALTRFVEQPAYRWISRTFRTLMARKAATATT